MGEIATGLGVLGFWLFIAAIIVMAIWSDSKRKESHQETLRRLYVLTRESGPQPSGQDHRGPQLAPVRATHAIARLKDSNRRSRSVSRMSPMLAILQTSAAR